MCDFIGFADPNKHNNCTNLDDWTNLQNMAYENGELLVTLILAKPEVGSLVLFA